MARVNEVLREVVAEEMERLAASEPRLELVTVTAVSCEPDLRHATVLLASLPDAMREALAEVRPRLQAAVAHQVRLKRTPQLSFQADPSVGHGQVVEEILAGLRASGELVEGDDGDVPAEEAGAPAPTAGAEGAGGQEANAAPGPAEEA